MSKLVKGIGSGVGWIREAQSGYEHRSPNAGVNPDTAADHTDHTEHDTETYSDEDQWALDDAQNEVTGLDTYMVNEQHGEEDDGGEGGDDKDKEDKKTRKVKKILAGFQSRHPPPPESQWVATGNLPVPVVLPQRRPGHKARGFVRAYAPVLEDAGIDQATFMDFLDCFDQAIKSAPWFHIANAAVLAHYAIPSATLHVAAMITHISIEAARRMRVKQKSNMFLDQMNETLFKPHGLYCLIFTYNPKSKTPAEEVNINDAIGSAVEKREDGHYNKFRSSAGTVEREVDLPDAAPLIFPVVESLPEEQKESFFKKHRTLGGDYYDRRARAEYEAKHPDTKLNVGESPQFSSRYADPNSTTNNGKLLSLLSGGHVDPLAMRQNKRDKMVGKRGRTGLLYSLKDKKTEKKELREEGQGGMMTKAKKHIKEQVIYLMVVNLPTQQEEMQMKQMMGDVMAGSE